MAQRIGEAAGRVWEYLTANGEATTSKIAKETGLPRDVAQRAIGWLAREGKLEITKDNRSERIRLQ